MSLELDHVFVNTAPGAPEADQLLSFGLVEGSSNVHPGQGTANRRFFFHNLMLELLWVNNVPDVRSAAIRSTYLWERWSGRDRGTCPFGICLRPTNLLFPPSSSDLPFASWSYHPPYLPPFLSISVAGNANVITEPMLFYIPFGRRQETYPSDRAEPLCHSVGFREVTHLIFSTPHADGCSPHLAALSNAGLICIQPAEAYHLTLIFDNMAQGQEHSFQPYLPLVFRW